MLNNSFVCLADECDIVPPTPKKGPSDLDAVLESVMGTTPPSQSTTEKTTEKAVIMVDSGK